ncbi:MAG: fucose isomerase [Candidatus Latescibacterota bacterium]
MYLPLGTFSPEVRLGLVSASRNCFPRSLSEQRTEALLAACGRLGVAPVLPDGECRIIETREHAAQAARQLTDAGCEAAVLYLGNFSPEIEDAAFVRGFAGPVMLIAAAEEAASRLASERGDALCGLLSAALAVDKRGLRQRLYLPPDPVVDAEAGAHGIAHFAAVARVVKGICGATIGLFGPRPRDFETCNYNLASLASIGVEVEELGLFDLQNEIRRIKKEEDVGGIVADMRQQIDDIPAGEFATRLGAYERAILSFRDRLRLSGATTQCWSEQEWSLQHVPCFINGRLAGRGFPIACENDAYSLVAELLGQYASGASVTILDLNHSIPADLHASLAGYRVPDLVGLFHCGNTDPRRLVDPHMHHQVIMKRLMEPQGEPDITRGTIEGQIAASPITVLQVHGVGDRLRAYVAQGEFLDLDPQTFGCAGTAHIPGFRRFYRHVLLGRFHHHAAVAFTHCGGVLYDAMRLLGIEEIHTPLPDGVLYPGENPFGAA